MVYVFAESLNKKEKIMLKLIAVGSILLVALYLTAVYIPLRGYWFYVPAGIMALVAWRGLKS